MRIKITQLRAAEEDVFKSQKKENLNFIQIYI